MAILDIHDERYFMIDIESTGLDNVRDHVLEIGILECLKQNDSTYLPGRTFNLIMRYVGEPETEFAREYMRKLYALCAEAETYQPYEVRHQIIEFLKSCGANGQNVHFMGWNCSNFDLPFLEYRGYLYKPGMRVVDGKQVAYGDYSYRIYELGGAMRVARDSLGISTEGLHTLLKTLPPTFSYPPGDKHRALHDCYTQLDKLNKLIAILRGNTKKDTVNTELDNRKSVTDSVKPFQSKSVTASSSNPSKRPTSAD